MPEVTGEAEVECTCPECGKKYTDTFEVTLEFDIGDFRPDRY